MPALRHHRALRLARTAFFRSLGGMTVFARRKASFGEAVNSCGSFFQGGNQAGNLTFDLGIP